MATRLDLLVRLKTTLIDFFDELIELLPEEADLVVARIFLNDQIPIEDIMNYIVYKLIPLKEMVVEQNDKFFLENNILFEQLDENKVNHFKRIWENKVLETDDRNTIWKWFRSFIFLAEKYNGTKS